MRKLLGFVLLSILWLTSAFAQTGNVGTYGIIQGSGSFIAISVDGSGNFAIKNSIIPNATTAVPIRTTIPGSGTGLVFTLDLSSNFTYAVSTASNPFGNVPVIGYAAGAISEIDINTGTGVVSAGSFSTTLAALVASGSSPILSSSTGTLNSNGSITFNGDDVLFASTPFTADVLIQAAGAGGGTSGGGGAGRVQLLQGVQFGKFTRIKIGRGGPGAISNQTSTRGGDSWVWTVGQDPWISSGGSPVAGLAINAPQWLTGSGGGAGTNNSGGPYIGGPGEGFSGTHAGGGTSVSTSPFAGGGGGGAGAAGQNQQARNIPGNGGDGLPFAISGSIVYYGGGGPGGCFNIGSAPVCQSATGGLGNAITSPATAVDGPQGIDGVGGGGSAAFASNTGGRGGDGVVIILPHNATYGINTIRPTANPVTLPITANLAAYYGVFRLSTWNGNCAQVIRASDSATLDIGFINNVCDLGAADTFAQASNARSSWTFSKFYDQSGLTNDLTTSSSAALTKPTADVLNAQQGGIRPFAFDSIGNTQNQLASNATITGNTNAVTVYQVVTPRTSLDYQGYWQLTDVTNNAAFYSNLYHNQQTNLRWQANGLALIDTSIYERGIPQAISISSSGSAGQIIRVNGTQVTSASNTTSQAFAGLRIGAAYNGTSNVFGIFDLWGFALYNAAHISVQIQSVEAALTAPLTIPSGFTKRLVYGGNSLVTGQLSTFNQQPSWQAGWGKGTEASLAQWEPILMGVAGSTLANENSTMRTIYAGLYDATKTTNAITIRDPTNDVAGITCVSQADCEAQADTLYNGTTLSLVAYLKSLGYAPVVVPGMIARAADTTANFKEYFRLRYNVDSSTGAVANGYTFSDRAGAGPTTGITAFNTPASASDLTRYGDGTHLLNYGYNAFGLTDRTAISPINWLLKRDINPASNDNDPMWLDKAA